MFKRITKTYSINMYFTITSPSIPSLNALAEFIHVVKKFDWLSVDFKITESCGYKTLRHTSMNFSEKQDILDALDKFNKNQLL